MHLTRKQTCCKGYRGLASLTLRHFKLILLESIKVNKLKSFIDTPKVSIFSPQYASIPCFLSLFQAKRAKVFGGLVTHVALKTARHSGRRFCFRSVIRWRCGDAPLFSSSTLIFLMMFAADIGGFACASFVRSLRMTSLRK